MRDHELATPRLGAIGVAPERRARPTVDEVVAVFRIEHQPMVRLAFLLVGDRDTAEDVVQDAYAVLFERWDRVDRPGAYLRRCVVNGAYDVMRRRRTARRWEAPIDEPVTDPADDDLLELVDALPAKQRLVVVLRHYEGLTTPEIAEVTGWPSGTVKNLHHRAMAQLRKVIDR